MRIDRLRQAMEKSGQNSASLAELIGRAERTIRRILAEDGNTSDDTVFLIAQALDVSSDYLLGLSDDPTPQMRVDNLSDDERAILTALRRGEPMEAIKIIASTEN